MLKIKVTNLVSTFTPSSSTVEPFGAAPVDLTGSISLKAVPEVDLLVTISAPNLPGTVPSTVIVPQGSSTASFPISVNRVNKRTVVPITVWLNGVTIRRNLTVNPGPP